ncbi:MAG: insulinase family protein [Bacteroidia bacterium]|nr:insulinase family protein [Bacteroidia bacterium]
MIDRTREPALKKPSTIELKDPVKIQGTSGWPLYAFHQPGYEITRIEIVFPAGMSSHSNFLMGPAVNQLMDDGTKTKTSFEISNFFESYGAAFYGEGSYNYASLTLVALSKHIDQLLPVVNEIISEPVFPEKELQHYRDENQQRLLVEQKKVSYQARKKFFNLLFGSTSVYGFEEKPDDFSSVSKEELIQFHKVNYVGKGVCVIISGNADEAMISMVDSMLPRLNSPVLKLKVPDYETSKERKLHIEKDNALQTAIRIGRTFPDRQHPDFIPFSILQTILGGYFGSRLMANIREEKGYTYGINTIMQSLPGVTAFYIATEVGKKVKDAAIEEIYKEMNSLNEPVGEDELNLVKNYLFGHFQRAVDGPLQLSKIFKTMHLQGADFGYFRNYLNALNFITPEVLSEMANKYLNRVDYHEVTVG